MPRYITITLEKRRVTAKALLLDDEAPRTCQAIWDSLPIAGPAFHGKYARNEIYAFVEPLVTEPGPENTTITPFTGDLCYFNFSNTALSNPGYGYEKESALPGTGQVVDLALFYGRNNLLINGDQGWVPGNVYGRIVEGLDDVIAAGTDIWTNGFAGERFSYARVE
ncbi:MAG: DUF3830 family protein [Acidipropionibacterium acidipropionici]|jgi:hypothetical protein|uniref:DUF3830 family protein n=2 Tax=Acidipropionibacterium acidipropionici TaxID=1748 RepID=K7SNX7_ACIA4|nr:DUF3830 family protein [Acidipropionibacterium acidipropionici]AFV90890.1 hypothetical protein PACID_31300 [Acidipropionibacterium acidipropionici ATCC 4875]